MQRLKEASLGFQTPGNLLSLRKLIRNYTWQAKKSFRRIRKLNWKKPWESSWHLMTNKTQRDLQISIEMKKGPNRRPRITYKNKTARMFYSPGAWAWENKRALHSFHWATSSHRRRSWKRRSVIWAHAQCGVTICQSLPRSKFKNESWYV